MAGKKWTLKSDTAADKKAGIKPGSAKDNALDRKRGVSMKNMPMKNMPMKSMAKGRS
jgi:hypothetical protein